MGRKRKPKGFPGHHKEHVLNGIKGAKTRRKRGNMPLKRIVKRIKIIDSKKRKNERVEENQYKKHRGVNACVTGVCMITDPSGCSVAMIKGGCLLFHNRDKIKDCIERTISNSSVESNFKKLKNNTSSTEVKRKAIDGFALGLTEYIDYKDGFSKINDEFKMLNESNQQIFKKFFEIGVATAIKEVVL